MELIETKPPFRRALATAREHSHSVGLVPTMGALHDGHLSLIDAAKASCDIVAVTIFVNALQFGDPSDLERYPRDLERDLALCRHHGVDVVFAPSSEEMYPGGQPATLVQPGPLAARFEGASRPGHFAGVATVVTKLLSLAGTCRAYFGEKDYQQLAVIRRLVEDLDLAVEVQGCPIVREPDGVAMSSRNARLSPAERAAAPVLVRALEAGWAVVETGTSEAGDPTASGQPPQGEDVVAAMWGVFGAEPLAAPDYAEVVDPRTLEPVEEVTGEVRLLVAATIGPVRLIDNMAAGPRRP